MSSDCVRPGGPECLCSGRLGPGQAWVRPGQRLVCPVQLVAYCIDPSKHVQLAGLVLSHRQAQHEVQALALSPRGMGQFIACCWRLKRTVHGPGRARTDYFPGDAESVLRTPYAKQEEALPSGRETRLQGICNQSDAGRQSARLLCEQRPWNFGSGRKRADAPVRLLLYPYQGVRWC